MTGFVTIWTLLLLIFSTPAQAEWQPSQTASEFGDIKQYYQSTLRGNHFAFIGNTLHIISQNGSRVNVRQLDSSTLQVNRKIPEDLSRIFETTENFSSFACLTAQYNACLIVYGSDGVEEKIAFIEKHGSTYVSKNLPLKVVSYYSSYLAQVQNDGWLLNSLGDGNLYFINKKGNFSAIPDVPFDIQVEQLGLRHIWSDEKYQAAGIIVDQHNILTDRKEKKWVLFKADLSADYFETPDGCVFETYFQGVFVCSAYKGADAVLRVYEPSLNHTVNLKHEINFGAAQIQKWVRPFGHGLLVPLLEEGVSKVKYVSVAGGIIKDINEQLDKVRSNGNLYLSDVNIMGSEGVFIRNSPVHPAEYLHFKLDSSYNHSPISRKVSIKPLYQQIAFFDARNIEVRRFRQKSRTVPYTVITNPYATGRAKGRAIISVYGSYGIYLAEGYLKEFGKYWIEQGGSFIFAHVRGGGGFGKKWQKAGFGTKKFAAVLDLEAVAEDLIQGGYAQNGSIELMAESAGGIIAGAAAIRRPDLFNKTALVAPCLVLWDNERGYCTQTDEFGDPTDAAQMPLMYAYSPGHLLSTAKIIPPFLVFQSKYDKIVPPIVTETFQKLRPDVDFLEHILIDSSIHGEQWDSPSIRADVAVRRLSFFLDYEATEDDQ